jgi:hypothetical protein
VEEACDARGRGGYEKIYSQGQQGPIEFEVYYKEEGTARPITYELAIEIDHTGRPYVLRERLRQLAGPQKHLNIHGDNLGNVVQFMAREHPDSFQKIVRKIANKIPGIHKIDTEKTNDGRLLLRFNDRGFEDPFFAQQMSDGTLKMFAYLV